MLRVNQLIGFGARRPGGSFATPTIVERGTFVEVSGSDPLSTSAKDIGTAAGDRVVIVAVSVLTAGADRHISGLTIGGVTATKQAGISNNTGDWLSSEIWTATVPTGTTAVLVFTFQTSAPARTEYTIFTATGLTTETPNVTGTAQGGASALSASLTTSSPAIVIGCFGQLGTSAAPDFASGIIPTGSGGYQDNGNFLSGVQQHATSGSKTFAMAAQVTSSQTLAACAWYDASSTVTGDAFNSGTISGSHVASYSFNGPRFASTEVTIVTGASTGTAAADRLSVAVICYRSAFAARLLTGVKINGVVATLATGAFVNSDPYCDIWYAANPSGTTGDIKATAAAAFVDVAAIHVFRLVGQIQNAPWHIGSMETASGSTRIMMPPSSFTIGGSGVNSSGSSTTLSGLTTDNADTTANDGFGTTLDSSAGHATGTGSNSTLSIGSNRGRLSFATWIGGSTSIDAYYSNVVLLWEAEGTDGQTTSLVEASHSRTITVAGTAHIESDQARYGSTSLYVGTAGASLADNDDWALADASGDQYTIEFSILQSTIASQWDVLNQTMWLTRIHNTGEMTFYWSPTGSGYQSFTTSGAGLGSTNTWYDICVEKNSSNKIRIYVNGVMKGSSTPSGADSVIFNGAYALLFSTHESNAGYLDHVRLTKGVARYDSDSGYTPSIGPFPTS